MKQIPVARRDVALSSIALTALALSSIATVTAAELAAPKPSDRTAGAASSKDTAPATPFQVGGNVLPLLEERKLKLVAARQRRKELNRELRKQKKTGPGSGQGAWFMTSEGVA